MSKVEMRICTDEEDSVVYSHEWSGVKWSEVMSIIEVFIDHALTTLSNETRIPRTLLLAMLTDEVEKDWKEGSQNG